LKFLFLRIVRSRYGDFIVAAGISLHVPDFRRAVVKWRVAPKFTESDIAKWKHKELTGTVSLVVSEAGDVIPADIVSVKPNEAAQAFLSAVRQGKFQPRPECRESKIDLTLKLHPDQRQFRDWR
jgi:hypothetical protein